MSDPGDFPTPPQREVLDCGLLPSGFDCILQMPTGSGKTWLAEQAIADVLAGGRRAIYLTPLRSLAAELTCRWQHRFAPNPVGVFTGDQAGKFPVSFHDARLLVMTPERLDACTRAWSSHWDWLPDVDLLVVDEFHLLGDRHRGPRLEGTLSRVRRLNPFVRLLCLSATLGNRGELADWLGAVDYYSAWRPVALRWRVVRYQKPTEKPELLRTVVSENVRDGGMGLVFVQSRRRAEEICGFLQGAGFRAAHHHAGLEHAERREVEGRFLGRAIDVLVATSTLEMGLNLPARQVVLYDLQRFDGREFRPLPCWNVWQRAGRAGRPGLDASGEAVLLAAAWDREAARYADGKFEPVRSGLANSRALAEQIVAEVSAGLARSAEQLQRVFSRSLAAYQRTLPSVDAVLKEMMESGMIEEARATEERKLQLRATSLGRIAVRHFLAPATVLLFRRILQAERDLTFFDLLLIAASSEDCEALLPVDREELEALTERLGREPSELLRCSTEELASILGVAGRRMLTAMKTAWAVREWTRQGEIESTATVVDCYPFEIRRLVETMVRLLAAMLAVSEPVDGDTEEVSTHERLRVLQRMVHGGLDEETVTLTLVPGIGPVMARRLREYRITDLEALAQAEVSDLRKLRGLSSARANRWIEQAIQLVSTRSAFCYRETVTNERLKARLPAGIDPYRLRRARDLTVIGNRGHYQVTGGLEPHRVAYRKGRWNCDCADRAEGNECKHILAVRLRQGDEELHAVVNRLESATAGNGLDLFALWYAPNKGER